jgi:hypothetical protein
VAGGVNCLSRGRDRVTRARFWFVCLVCGGAPCSRDSGAFGRKRATSKALVNGRVCPRVSLSWGVCCGVRLAWRVCGGVCDCQGVSGGGGELRGYGGFLEVGV